MKFYLDECISPSLSRHLNEGGLHDAVHSRDRGRLREPESVVFTRAIEEDRIVLTENANDFRSLAAKVELHPGLIILPSLPRLEAQMLMDLVVAYLESHGGKRRYDLLVNAVLSITPVGIIQVEPLP